MLIEVVGEVAEVVVWMKFDDAEELSVIFFSMLFTTKYKKQFVVTLLKDSKLLS